MNVIGGLNYPFVKSLLIDAPYIKLSPTSIVLIRHFISFLFFAVAGFILKKIKIPSHVHLVYIAIGSLLGLFLNPLFFILGQNLTDVYTASIMNSCLIPVFTYLFSLITRIEKISFIRSLSILFGVLTVLLTTYREIKFNIGVIYLLMNCACYAMYLMILKKIRAVKDSIDLMFWLYAFSLPFAVLTDRGKVFDVLLWKMKFIDFWALGYYVFFISILWYFFIGWISKWISPTLTAIFPIIHPIVAYIFYIYEVERFQIKDVLVFIAGSTSLLLAVLGEKILFINKKIILKA